MLISTAFLSGPSDDAAFGVELMIDLFERIAPAAPVAERLTKSLRFIIAS
jgi:hypothetical protein